jgi:serine/arginine repetitive matrix protein 1
MAAGTGSFFKGTSHEQDARFKDKEKKLIQSTKWPEEFDKPVDISKVWEKTQSSRWSWG